MSQQWALICAICGVREFVNVEEGEPVERAEEKARWMRLHAAGRVICPGCCEKILAEMETREETVGLRVDGFYLDDAIAIPLGNVALKVEPAPAVASSEHKTRKTMEIETPHLHYICSNAEPQAVIVTRDATYIATPEQSERWFEEVT